MAKKVTSFDVAQLAGVSQPTVSRALRNLPGTSPATRDRVRQAARELSYVPSDTGRSLSTQRTRRIAVVSDELTNPYYPELVEPVRRYLSAHGYRTVLLTETSATDDHGPAVDDLADGSYDGALLTTTLRRSSLPRDLSERGLPHVLVNRVLDVAESPSCTVDNARGSAEIADLVASLGHRRVGAIHGPVGTSTGRERAEALVRRLRHHGIAPRRHHTRRAAFGHDTGMQAAVDILRSPDPPTALICANDVLALGALSAARRLSLRVPQDLTIIGFDDIPMASWPLVDLTTVRCDLDALAREAVLLLLDEIREPSRAPQLRTVPVSLQVRGTHAAPP